MVVATKGISFPTQTSHLYNILSMRKFLGYHRIHVSHRLTGANDEYYAQQPKTDHLMLHLWRFISYYSSIIKSTPQHTIWFLFLGFFLQISLADSLCVIVLHQTQNRSSYAISTTSHPMQNILFGHFHGASHIIKHQNHITIRRISTMVPNFTATASFDSFGLFGHRLTVWKGGLVAS